METPENKGGPEIEGEKAYWVHPCQSCKLEGSTSFTEQGGKEKMDVYSCSNHVQPGVFGGEATNFKGDRIVVRYANPTNDTIGEISFDRATLDIEALRSRARHRQGKTDYAPAQIAIGKIL